MADCRAPVAVFDSGLGGISVLRELVRTLPMENYLYFGELPPTRPTARKHPKR